MNEEVLSVICVQVVVEGEEGDERTERDSVHEE